MKWRRANVALSERRLNISTCIHIGNQLSVSCEPTSSGSSGLPTKDDDTKVLITETNHTKEIGTKYEPDQVEYNPTQL